MQRKNSRYFVFICSVLFSFVLVLSCAHKSGPHGRDRNLNRHRNGVTQRTGKHTIVNMRNEDGVYYVPIVVNGLNLDFIFDTGASSICISLAEATVMMRQGKITRKDVIGEQQFQDATGNISVGTTVILRTVQIGEISLYNVEAVVVDNINAPLLLGQTALAQFGRVTIDYNNNTIEFN